MIFLSYVTGLDKVKFKMEIPSKLSEKTLVSLHLVIILIGFAVWLIRLGDKVEQHEKILIDMVSVQKDSLKTNNKIDRRLYRLEENFGIKHPTEPEER